MDSNQRVELTRFIWVALMIATVVVTVFGDLGGTIVPVLLFMLGAGVMVTGFVWNWGDGSLVKQQASRGSISEEFFGEKRKRDELDDVLRDLSDEELIRLRQRLSDGSVDDDMLYEQIIGTDGEFVRHS